MVGGRETLRMALLPGFWVSRGKRSLLRRVRGFGEVESRTQEILPTCDDDENDNDDDIGQ